jgi:hypothetical protein
MGNDGAFGLLEVLRLMACHPAAMASTERCADRERRPGNDMRRRERPLLVALSGLGRVAGSLRWPLTKH